MKPSIGDITKKRGRPKTTGKGLGLLVRLQTPDLKRLDSWIAAQPEPLPSRPEAIRRLVEKGLDSEGADQRESAQRPDASLDQKIANQETVIAQMHQHSEPSPEAGMAAMDKAVAENDLIDMKNKRTRRKNAKRG
jgi:hypothetical protein